MGQLARKIKDSAKVGAAKPRGDTWARGRSKTVQRCKSERSSCAKVRGSVSGGGWRPQVAGDGERQTSWPVGKGAAKPRGDTWAWGHVDMGKIKDSAKVQKWEAVFRVAGLP